MMKLKGTTENVFTEWDTCFTPCISEELQDLPALSTQASIHFCYLLQPDRYFLGLS